MKIVLKNDSDLIFERGGKDIKLYDSIDSLANGHDYVEIGDIKWATMNVGATGVTDYGLHFAWGETDGYLASQVGTDKQFSWADYKFNPSHDGSTMTKYESTDAYRTLVPCDDPVTTNLGGAWRLPTKEEFVVLSGTVTTEWVENYQGSGVNGLVLTDKTDSNKKLFFPAAGYGYDGSMYDVESHGLYLSSSLYEDYPANACSFLFDSEDVNWEYDESRRAGFSVRGVLD